MNYCSKQTFKSYEERVIAADKMTTEADQCMSLFNKLTSTQVIYSITLIQSFCNITISLLLIQICLQHCVGVVKLFMF